VPTATDTPAPPDATATPTPPCGDVNHDGRVTLIDVAIELRESHHQHANARYDLNGDGQVDEVDVLIVSQQLGRRCRR
jgi:hypothetical protein